MMWFSRQIALAEQHKVIAERLARRRIARLAQQRCRHLGGAVLTRPVRFAQRIGGRGGKL